MKIVCDACGTKYSIGDDRVAGKVFKIRCKKCSQIIVVRGAALEPAVEAVAAGEWHLAIDGNQSGPFDRADLVRRHADGELDDDSLVWRDGMDEWAPFGSIAELSRGTMRSERAPAAAEPETSDAMFSTGASSAFASASADVFGRATAPAPAPVDDKKLLAERNENSVLFTLGNLAKLASDSRPSAAKDAPAKPGAAGGEGSGLIDIRALASTFAKPGAAKPATAVGSLDDLPTFGPTTFGEPIVLMPAARQRVDRKMIYALFAALAMLAIVGTVLLVIVLRSPSETHASTGGSGTRVAELGTKNPVSNDGIDGIGPTGSPGSTGAAGSTSATGSTGATNAPGSTSATGSTSTTGSTTGSTNAAGSSTSATGSTRPTMPSTSATRPATSTTRPSTSSATTRPSTSTTSTTTTRPTTSTTSTTTRPSTATTTTTTRPTAPDKVQCEFSGYADKGCEIYKPTTSTTIASNLPDNLDRGAIAAGLGTIRAQACGGRSSSRGDVSVQIKVNAEGGVSGVTVKSSPDPALSSCVVAAAQKGTFSKTKRGASFGYVWRF